MGDRTPCDRRAVIVPVEALADVAGDADVMGAGSASLRMM
jgi:hypothetical protein